MTTFKKIANRVSTTIKAGSSINNTDDPVIFNVTDASKLPAVSFYFTVEKLTDNSVYEIMLATDVTGDQITATREQDGTTKQTFSAGDLVQIRVISAHINDITTAIGALESSISNWDSAYSHSQLTSGNPHNVSAADVGLSNAVLASAVIDDNVLVRGDGGARGVQGSGITIDDSNNVSGITEMSSQSLKINSFKKNAVGWKSIAANTTTNIATLTMTSGSNTDLMVKIIISGGENQEERGSICQVASFSGRSTLTPSQISTTTTLWSQISSSVPTITFTPSDNGVVTISITNPNATYALSWAFDIEILSNENCNITLL